MELRRKIFYRAQEVGHLARDCPKGKSSQGSDGRDPKDKRQLNTCYNCHQRGHKSTECPNNAFCCEDQSRERRQENERGSYRTGRDNNQLVHDVLLDTGASRTMVRKELVSEDDLTGEETTIRCAHGDVVLYLPFGNG